MEQSTIKEKLQYVNYFLKNTSADTKVYIFEVAKQNSNWNIKDNSILFYAKQKNLNGFV